MTLSILNVGTPENEALFGAISTPEEEPPVVRTVADFTQAHAWASLHRPDIVIVDLRDVGEVDRGTEFISLFRKNLACDDIPILAVVHRYRDDDVLLAGASQVIAAPLDRHRSRTAVLSALSASAQQRVQHYRSQWLEEGLSDLPKGGQLSEHETLFRLLQAGEFCDKETSTHVRRVGKIGRRIAQALGRPASECDVIELASPLHDIGKIGIPGSILRKPGPLTQDERRTMQTHTRIGYDILKSSRSASLQCAAQMSLAHHERFDGTGYPNGLRGEEIPLAARIVAVADVYDALSHRRPYKLAWSAEKAAEYLVNQKARHFDPQCVDALLSRVLPVDQPL